MICFLNEFLDWVTFLSLVTWFISTLALVVTSFSVIGPYTSGWKIPEEHMPPGLLRRHRMALRMSGMSFLVFILAAIAGDHLETMKSKATSSQLSVERNRNVGGQSVELQPCCPSA